MVLWLYLGKHLWSCWGLLQYLKKFDLSPVYTEEEFQHWFIPRPGIVDSYVVEVRQSLPFQEQSAVFQMVIHHGTCASKVSTFTCLISLAGRRCHHRLCQLLHLALHCHASPYAQDIEGSLQFLQCGSEDHLDWLDARCVGSCQECKSTCLVCIYMVLSVWHG